MRGATRSSAIRIGYCIDSFDIGGTELNAVRTVEALDLDRFDVTVFHLHADGPIRSRYEALGVDLIHLPISRLYGPTALIQGMRFGALLRRRDIEIVHTHDLYTNIFGAPWASVIGRSRVIASRRWLYEAPRAGLTRLNRWSYRFATRVLANSAAVKDLLILEGVPEGKIVELPNFIEERAFTQSDEMTRARQREVWGVPQPAFVVGIVARLAPVKHHSALLRAAAMLDDSVHLVLIGGGPERGALERLSEELGIGTRVHFLGQMTSSINLHQYFDVSVLCSRSEGFPNSLIEALAAARPVVATPVGGVRDVIVDNVSGLLVPVDDARALAARIRALQEDPELRLRLASNGLAQVRRTYHQSVVMTQLHALYESLASPTAQARSPPA